MPAIWGGVAALAKAVCVQDPIPPHAITAHKAVKRNRVCIRWFVLVEEIFVMQFFF